MKRYAHTVQQYTDEFVEQFQYYVHEDVLVEAMQVTEACELEHADGHITELKVGDYIIFTGTVLISEDKDIFENEWTYVSKERFEKMDYKTLYEYRYGIKDFHLLCILQQQINQI